MRFSWTALAVAGATLVTAQACVAPRTGDRGGPFAADSAFRRADAPPVLGIIGYRERLGLTSQQVVALDSINDALRMQVQPLRDRLVFLRDSFGGRNGAMNGAERRAFWTASQPMVEEMRTHNQRAAAAVHETLTPAQRTTVCEIFAHERPRRRPTTRPPGGRQGQAYPGAVGGGPTGRRAIMAPDSVGTRPRSALFWCAPPAAADADADSAPASPR